MRWLGGGRRVVATALAGLALVAGACSSNADADKGGSTTNVSLRLDFSWVPDHIPYLWAAAKGYYKDAGLNVEIQQGQGSASTMTLVGTGKNQFGWGDLGTAALQVSKGVPLDVAAVLTRRTPFGTECFKDVNFRSPKDLVGRSAVLIPQESVAQIWPAYLKASGVDPSQVRVVSATFANKFTLFIQHRADCMADYYGIGLDIARAANPDIGQPVAWEQNGIHTLSQGLVVNDGYAKANPDVVKAFIAASLRGWKDVCANVPAAIGFYATERPELNKKASDKQLNQVRLQYECDSTKPLPGTGATQYGPSTDAEWKPMLDILHQYGGLTNVQSPSAYYTNQYLPAS
ncbi:MAG TPA: ABC transporter substrate-binding protein [Actinomycetes bacterium]|jgi:NitT/TauT family transport system substrate-binding protein|nr:ABC transporter substrate-binding protein [Actinomycetes bacterium]